jgi:hypothetical protein
MRGAEGRSGGSMIVRLALKKRTKHGQRSMYAMGQGTKSLRSSPLRGSKSREAGSRLRG